MLSVVTLFPGQGSQHVGMGQSLFDNFTEARALFEEGSDALGQDLKKLCFAGPEADLALTENTQPALLLASVATFTVVRERVGLSIAATAGHSVGEYASAVTSGAIPFADAMQAVRARGQAMQSAVPLGQGGMLAAMGLTPEQVQAVCAWTNRESGLGPVEPANYNAPGQIVLSGKKAALEWLAANFKPEVLTPPPSRTRFIPLNVSAPFHCSLMKPAEEVMAHVLGDMKFQSTAYPIVQNVTAKPAQEGADIRKNLIAQVSAPVRWIECVEQLATFPPQLALELGPGKVISGLVKKILPERWSLHSIQNADDIKALETLV